MDKTKLYGMLLKIEETADDLKYSKQKYLEARGWLYSSSFVGAHWMWCKRIDDRLVVVDTDTALSLQNSMDGISGFYEELAEEGG